MAWAPKIGFPLRFEEGEEVGGVYLATLAQRRPDLKQELSELRTQLASETTDSLKVWKLRDLSLQATQATIDAQDPLRTLKDLSQDFPRHAAGLSARRVRDDLRDASQTAHAYSMHSGLSGRALVFLVGLLMMLGLRRSPYMLCCKVFALKHRHCGS